MAVARLAAWTTLYCEGGDYPHDDDFNVARFSKEFRLRLGSRYMIHNKLRGSSKHYSFRSLSFIFFCDTIANCMSSGNNDQTHFSVSVKERKRIFPRPTNYNLDWL